MEPEKEPEDPRRGGEPEWGAAAMFVGLSRRSRPALHTHARGAQHGGDAGC